MINPWDVPAKLTMTPDPYQAIMTGLLAKKAAYDEGETSLTALEDSFLKIGSLPVNAPRKNQLIGEYQKEAYDIVDQYSNDLGAALPRIKQLQRKLNTDLATGELGGIKGQYDEYLERAKELEVYKKKFMESGGKEGLSPEDADALLNFEITNPGLNGSPIKKTKYGTWEKYKPFTTMPSLNYMAVADEFASKMKPEIITQLTGLMPVKDASGNITGYMQHGNVKTTMLPSEAIELATAEAMKLDSRVTGYRDWQATISGKADKVARAIQEKPNGFLSPDGMSTLSPDYVADVTMNDGIYNAAKAMGLKYRQSEIERTMSYMDDWVEKENYKAAKEAGYNIIAQGPSVDLPGSNLDPLFFDVQTGVRVVPYTAEEKAEIIDQTADPLDKAAVAATLARGRVVSRGIPYYKDLATLSPSQKIQTDAYLKTLEKDPAFKDAVARVREGKGSEADNKLVYPALKKMSQAAIGAGKMNTVVESVSDEDLPAYNRMLGSSKDQTATVKSLGSGFAVNMKFTAKNSNVPMTYKQFVDMVANKGIGPDATVMITGKLRGANPYTNMTGDRTYGNALQITVGGEDYYIHGDYQIDRSTPIGEIKDNERIRNEFVASFAQAQTAPTGTFSANYFNTPIEWVYMPDINDPNKGTYRLTGIGPEGGEVIPLEQNAAMVFNSAEEMETALALMKYQGQMPGK